MADRIRKTVRFNDETQKMLNELKSIYKLESENALLEVLIREIYEQKQSKALVPFEELEKRDKELKQAFFEVGKLQGVLLEKNKNIEELKQLVEKYEQLEKNRPRGFWARLFGL